MGEGLEHTVAFMGMDLLKPARKGVSPLERLVDTRKGRRKNRNLAMGSLESRNCYDGGRREEFRREIASISPCLVCLVFCVCDVVAVPSGYMPTPDVSVAMS